MTEYDRIRLVNKSYPMKSGEIPKELWIPSILFVEDVNNIGNKERIQIQEKRYLVKECGRWLENLIRDGKQLGYIIVGVSGYRSYERQKEIYETSLSKNGRIHTEKYIAKAGTSEHQTGLAIDITTEEVGYELTEHFIETKEYLWITKYCANYGFIIRYPKGKEEITGYGFEPWHLRYVGRTVAEEITRNHLTLEEFWQEKMVK